MNIKNIMKISTIILSIYLSNAFATGEDILCPPTDKVLGSNFKAAYNPKNYTWILVSHLFLHENRYWQTNFTIDLSNVIDPRTAIAKGEQIFYKLPLLSQPSQTNPTNDETDCAYTPDAANYKVVAINLHF